MKKILVSLISQQTLPNFMLIKDEKFQNVDEYIFVNTELTIKRGIYDNLLSALGLAEEQYRSITVKEDSRENIREKIAAENLDAQNSYVINMTGGTKPMSLWTLEYFQENMEQLEAYYLTFPKPTYKRTFPYGSEATFELSYEISLKEYLDCYGVEIENNEINYTLTEAPHPPEELVSLSPKSLRRKIKETPNPSQYGRYYTGNQWFEEYLYKMLKSALPIKDNQIAFGVKFKHTDAEVENEFDIMFIYKNKLHVVEAKTAGFLSKQRKCTKCNQMFQDKEKGKDLYYSSLYKLTAVKRNFGLFIQGYIFTKDKLRQENKVDWMVGYKRRADSLSIKLLDGKHIFPRQIKDQIISLIDPALTSQPCS